jgi:hypothetical protein
VIRHGKTPQSWDTLEYSKLLDLIKLRDDPEPDMEFLKANLDMQKALNLAPKKIYSSPLKRAMMTAEYIAEITGSDIIRVEGLKEVSFDKLPKEVYDAGKEAIRGYLVEESLKEKRDLDLSMFDDGSMLLTHGFFMRHIYSKAFGVEVSSLVRNGLFTNYLSGFDTEKGNSISLLKH